MNISRAFISGCGGMLGHAVYPYFAQRCGQVLATDKVVSEPWLEKLDIRDTARMREMLDSFRPELVLHLAAETDLEFCERHADAAEATNDRSTRAIAEICESIGATLVYISTAGVFDGQKEGFYTEDDQPNPIMVYGQTKLAGEHHARGRCGRSFVIRAGWMVGGGIRKDHKFVSKILAQIFDGKKVIHAVNDKWGTPTYTHDFAMNLFRLLETEAYGTYHMVCGGSGTRYDVAVMLASIFGRSDIEVRPVDSSFFQAEYFAPRPRSEMLRNANLERMGLNLMRNWQDALRDYVNREYVPQMSALSGTYEPVRPTTVQVPPGQPAASGLPRPHGRNRRATAARPGRAAGGPSDYVQ
jgi:dTDP-4-dehydrorhamnose reductase